MKAATKILDGVGEVISSERRFAARYRLQFPVVDEHDDSIENAPVESITGFVMPMDGMPIAIFAGKELRLEMFGGPNFTFSFHSDGTCDITVKRRVRSEL